MNKQDQVATASCVREWAPNGDRTITVPLGLFLEMRAALLDDDCDSRLTTWQKAVDATEGSL